MSSDLSQLRVVLYLELIEEVAKGPICDPFVLPVVELGSFWSRAAVANYISNSKFRFLPSDRA